MAGMWRRGPFLQTSDMPIKVLPAPTGLAHQMEVVQEALECMQGDAINELVLPKDPKCSKYGNVWPGGNNGRLAYCLARHQDIQTIVDYFPGYPARGGTYCLAQGNKFKHQHGLPFKPIQAPEMVRTYYEGLINMFKMNHLEAYVNLTNDKIGWANAQTLCPAGHVDLWVSDFACSAPSVVWQSLLSLCIPKFWLMTNSGMICGCGERCDVWHRVEDFVFHQGHLPFPPYTKYHPTIPRVAAQLYDVTEDRHMMLYARHDPPQYARPSHALLERFSHLSVPFEDPCPPHDKANWPEFCEDEEEEAVDGHRFGTDGGC